MIPIHLREEEDFTPENSETVWECHGLNFVYKFIHDIPQMDKGHDYCFFKLTADKYREGLEFPMFMIATMLPRVDADELTWDVA